MSTFLRKVTDFLLHSRLQAMSAAFVLAYIPLIGSVSILITALVTLRKGAWEGFWVLIAATVPYILSYYASGFSGNIAFIAMIIIVVSNCLVWLLAVLLMKGYTWSLLLEYSLLSGIIFIALLHLFYPEIRNWWGNELNEYFKKSSSFINNLKSDDKIANDVSVKMAASIDSLKGYASGLVVVSVLFNAFFQLLIARWWQAIIFNPGGLHKELYVIRMSCIVGLLFIVIVAWACFKGETAIDMLPILLATFAIAGFSLLHAFLAKAKFGWLWLTAVYIGFVLLFPISLGVISILAFLDVWMDFRKRFIKQYF